MVSKKFVFLNSMKINFIIIVVFAFFTIIFSNSVSSFVSEINDNYNQVKSLAKGTDLEGESLLEIVGNKETAYYFSLKFQNEEYSGINKGLYSIQNNLYYLFSYRYTIVTVVLLGIVLNGLFIINISNVNTEKKGIFYNQLPISRKDYFISFVLSPFIIVLLLYLLDIILVFNKLDNISTFFYENFNREINYINIFKYVGTFYLYLIIVLSIFNMFYIICRNKIFGFSLASVIFFLPKILINCATILSGGSYDNIIKDSQMVYKILYFLDFRSIFQNGIYFGEELKPYSKNLFEIYFVLAILLLLANYYLFINAKFLSNKLFNFSVILKISKFFIPPLLGFTTIFLLEKFCYRNSLVFSNSFYILVLIITTVVSYLFYNKRFCKE